MRYGAFLALDQVSFEANEGQIFGLLGPNGAGKTMVMRILTTFLYPTSGSAVINGHDIIENPMAVRKATGYLPETAPLYMDMRVDEYLAFVGESRGLHGKMLKDRLGWINEACGLKFVWKHTIFEVSKGYRQRIGLGQALIHDPQVLILDEPTSGLDPLQIIGIRELIRQLARKKTIIFSTHILPEVEALADRIVIINSGKIIAQGTKQEIVEKTIKEEEVLLTVKAPREEIERELRAIPNCGEVRYEGGVGHDYERFRVLSKSNTQILSQVDSLIKRKGWPLRELSSPEMDLEQVFISLLSGSQSK